MPTHEEGGCAREGWRSETSIARITGKQYIHWRHVSMITSKTTARRLLCGAIAALLLSPAAQLAAQSTDAPSYHWHNARIVAGGYVDGIIAHPKQQGLFYARTDVGGAYRYDAKNNKWIALNDWVPSADQQWTGIESIAIDPNHPNMLYMVAGLYVASWSTNGA